MMMTTEYEKLFEPYLVAAFAAVDWPSGFSARLLLAVKLHKDAVGQLENEHGIADPRSKNPNILKIIERLVPTADPEDEGIHL